MFTLFVYCVVPNSPYNATIVSTNTSSVTLQFWYEDNSVFDQILIELNSSNNGNMSRHTSDVTPSTNLSVEVTLNSLTAGDAYDWRAYMISGSLLSEAYNSDIGQIYMGKYCFDMLTLHDL